MAGRCSYWKMVLPTATLTAVPFVVAAPTAQAFFPPITQTHGPVGVVDRHPTPIPPNHIPPVPPPPVPPPPTPLPPEPPPHHCQCAHTVPEPSTLVTGVAGLAAAAGWAARRKSNRGD